MTDNENNKTQFCGKKLSILGDSISTFDGVSNDGAENLSNNAVYYTDGIIAREQTYWQRVIDSLGMELCINNSWSGGFVAQCRPGMNKHLDPDGSISCGAARASKLHKKDVTSPDYIIVYLGINDVAAGVARNIFATAYEKMLDIIVAAYPNAKTFCLNIPDVPEIRPPEEYNAIIENAVNSNNNVYLIDLYNTEYSGYGYSDNSIDGVHPDANGMRRMSEIIIAGMKKTLARE